jgi:hypothetical protein
MSIPARVAKSLLEVLFDSAVKTEKCAMTFNEVNSVDAEKR